MNAAYVYNSHEAASVITNRIFYFLEQNHWSVKTLSDESNIPYETLKKLLSKKTENTSFHNIMKIALAFQCDLKDLVEPAVSPQTGCAYPGEIQHSFTSCGVLQRTLVPLLSPISLLDADRQENLPFQDTFDASSYPEDIRKDIAYGIRISSYCYHPVYQEKDILLISRKRPPYPGEIGIFMHHRKLYIRIFTRERSRIVLESLTGLGSDIFIYDFSEWDILGYVIGVHRD